MASLDKFLYNFGKYKKLDKMGLTGFSSAVGGGATVNVLLVDSASKVLLATGTTVPGSVAGYAKGCLFIDTNIAAGTKALYENQGDTTTASFNLTGSITSTDEIDSSIIQVATVSISAAQICTATTIRTLIAAPATGYYIDLIGATLTYKYAVAAYGGGGNITIGLVAGAALTGLVSAANSFGAGADWIYKFAPLAVAGTALAKETAIGLQTSGTFTQPGTAAGTAECTIVYRVLPIET